MAETRSGQHPSEVPHSDDVTRVDGLAVGGLSGTTLCGRYRLDRLIGSGGMAQVWEATDLTLGRQVAVKVLHPHLGADEALVSRFRAEAVAAARLSHPGIVGVYDTCSDGSHEAIVLELLDASTLRQHLDDHGPLEADTTIRLAMRLLDALEAAHRSGLVHRDVKPSNILLCRDGRVKIADFGIAKTEDQTELTQEGSLVGTASYLAPEQLLGSPVDGRADLYSLGIVIYECLTGRVPFQGDSGAAVAVARLHTDPIDPRQIRADVPARVAGIVMRLLARDPADRFDSAADVRAALLDLGVEADVPAPDATELQIEDPTEAEEHSFARSERRWLVPALFILLIGVAVTVAGVLLRETASGSDDADPTPAPDAPAAPDSAPLAIDVAVPFDPQGRGEPGEKDELAGLAVDRDTTTAWRTEAYDPPGLFSKSGVGFAVTLPEPARVTGLQVDGSDNGWSAEVFVLDAADLDTDALSEGRIEGLAPDELPSTAVVEDVRGPVSLDLSGAPDIDGQVVLIWITDLGDPVDNGRHRVELAEIALEGTPLPTG